MNVNAASSATDLWKLLQSQHVAATSGISSSTSTSGSSSVTSAAGDGSSLSSAARLFSTLHNLSQSNPAEFQKITAQIATQLQQAASTADDPSQKSALSQLAANFQSASKSGNFSDLFSQNGSDVASTAHVGGHHHHYHAGNDATTSAANTQGDSDPLSSIFSNALAQIADDVKTSTSSVPVAS